MKTLFSGVAKSQSDSKLQAYLPKEYWGNILQQYPHFSSNSDILYFLHRLNNIGDWYDISVYKWVCWARYRLFTPLIHCDTVTANGLFPVTWSDSMLSSTSSSQMLIYSSGSELLFMQFLALFSSNFYFSIQMHPIYISWLISILWTRVGCLKPKTISSYT